MTALIRLYRGHERLALGLLSMSLFLIAWQGLADGWWADALQRVSGQSVTLLRIKPIFLASPWRIATTAWQLYFVTGEMWRHLGLSAFEFSVAFVAALVVGMPAGLIAGRNRLLSYAADPLLTALSATPQVALIPLVVLWMGTDVTARIFIIALLMLVPILINAHAAARTIDPRLLKLARSFGASERQVFRSIVLPSATPYLLAGTRFAIGRGMIGIVVGEIYGSSTGVGVMINQSGAQFQTARVFVGVLTIVVAGMALSELVRRIEKRCHVWRQPSLEQA